MNHMVPEILFETFVIVTAKNGESCAFPADVVPLRLGDEKTVEDVTERVAQFTEYDASDIDTVETKDTWAVRLTAPGYLDCTEFELCDSEAEAEERAAELMGEE